MPLAWIALNAVNGLGPVRFGRLLECYRTPEAVFEQPAGEIARRCGIPLDIAREIGSPALREHARAQLDAAAACGASVITLGDREYPAMLREIFAPPPVLFVKGQTKALGRHCVAVVGTRNPTAYGKQAAAVIAAGLVDGGLAIVSGLARGIDTLAHQAAIDRNGTTIAVLGCGIDTVYPASNRELAEAIMHQGALVSEFPLNTPPETFNFPRRNRIISGLSAGVLVVEAGVKSGSLITANYALQQNRDVFAVPGPIFSDKSQGTFSLIRNGAVPVRAADDIIGAVRAVKSPDLFTPQKQQLPASLTEHFYSEPEQKVLKMLDGSALRLDQIADQTAIAMGALYDVLLNLELKGAIRQEPGQVFVKT